MSGCSLSSARGISSWAAPSRDARPSTIAAVKNGWSQPTVTAASRSSKPCRSRSRRRPAAIYRTAVVTAADRLLAAKKGSVESQAAGATELERLAGMWDEAKTRDLSEFLS